MPPCTHDPSQWAWHRQRLQYLRDRLLEDSGLQMAEVSETLEPHSMDIADSATDEFDHDLALSLLTHEQDALYELNAAIRRIEEGCYGICEETGQPIPASRLRAVPWTRHMREVEARLEREGAVSRLHMGAVTSLQGPAPGGLPQIDEPEEDELLNREVVRHERVADIKAIESGTDTEAGTTPMIRP